MKTIKVNMHQIRNDVNQGFNYPQQESDLADSNGNINITCDDCNFDLNPNDCDCDETLKTTETNCDCSEAVDNIDTFQQCNMNDDNIYNNTYSQNIIDKVLENPLANDIEEIKVDTNIKNEKKVISQITEITNVEDLENNLKVTYYEKHCETLEYFDNNLDCENQLYKKQTCTCRITKEYK